MKQNLDSFSAGLIGIAVVIGFIFIIALFISGGAWLIDKLLPGFFIVAGIWSLVNLLVFLPAGYFKNNKDLYGKSMMFSSFFLGATLWLWCLVLTFKMFGWLGVIIGVILLGVGMIPAGFLAALFMANINILIGLIVLCILVVFFRVTGMKFLFNFAAGGTSANSQKTAKGDDVIDVEVIDEDK